MGILRGEGIHWTDDAACWMMVAWTFGLRDVFVQAVGYVLYHETAGVIAELPGEKFPPGVKGVTDRFHTPSRRIANEESRLSSRKDADPSLHHPRPSLQST